MECQGEKISSTCIRERLLKGKVEELPDFLGHSYEVKCEWDGLSLNLNPYYTLPAPGRYGVTLKNECGSMQTEVIVMEIKMVITKMYDRIPLFMKGKISIVWHRRIREENVQTSMSIRFYRLYDSIQI